VSIPVGHGRHQDRCRQAREAVSATLDAEAIEVPPAALAAHLERCPECRAFLAGARDLQYQLAVSLPPDVPDLSTQILGTAPYRRSTWRAVRALGAARPALRRRTAWVAVALPLVLVISGVGAGALTPRRVVGTHPPTPCTAHLTGVSKTQGEPPWEPHAQRPSGSRGRTSAAPTASVRSRGSAQGQDSRT